MGREKDGESVSAFQVLIPTAVSGFASRDMHHGHPLEPQGHDMMRPYVVRPRRLPHGVAYGHGPDARIPGRPPSP
jgi:hypothetical protein